MLILGSRTFPERARSDLVCPWNIVKIDFKLGQRVPIVGQASYLHVDIRIQMISFVFTLVFFREVHKLAAFIAGKAVDVT